MSPAKWLSNRVSRTRERVPSLPGAERQGTLVERNPKSLLFPLENSTAALRHPRWRLSLCGKRRWAALPPREKTKKNRHENKQHVWVRRPSPEKYRAPPIRVASDRPPLASGKHRCGNRAKPVSRVEAWFPQTPDSAPPTSPRPGCRLANLPPPSFFEGQSGNGIVLRNPPCSTRDSPAVEI